MCKLCQDVVLGNNSGLFVEIIGLKHRNYSQTSIYTETKSCLNVKSAKKLE